MNMAQKFPQVSAVIVRDTCENYTIRNIYLPMSAQEIKQELASLSPAEQNEITAYLFQLRHAGKTEYQSTLERRLNDREPAHWLTLEELEKRLDSN